MRTFKFAHFIYCTQRSCAGSTTELGPIVKVTINRSIASVIFQREFLAMTITIAIVYVGKSPNQYIAIVLKNANAYLVVVAFSILLSIGQLCGTIQNLLLFDER